LIGIAALFSGIFFFYNSGDTKTKMWEFLAILSIATVAGSYTVLPYVSLGYKHPFSASLNMPIIPAMYSVVLFATLIHWVLNSSGRWIVALSVMLSISLFFLVVLLLETTSINSGYVTIIMPIPAPFLLVTALSGLVMKVNAHYTIDNHV